MIVLDIIVNGRGKMNVSGGYWIASPDGIGIHFGRSFTVPFVSGDWFSIFSDGFGCLFDHYGVDYGELGQESLEDLAGKIRLIERNDADCIKYPRFKVSDDLAVLRASL